MSITNEEELFDMSDEELEAAFKAAKAEEASPETDIEQNTDFADDIDDAASEEDFTQEDDISTENKELESDLEQPEADSNHDTSTDTEEDETDTEDSETDSSNPDGDPDEEDDTSNVDEEDLDSEVQPVQSHQVRANGKTYEFTDKEIQEQFPKIFGQAMDYTKKMQTIKPWRKTIDAIEQAELNHDDINLMIDVLQGNKDAISEVIKRTGVDTLDLDAENSNYEAKDYGRDEQTLAIKDVIDDISKDNEYGTTHKILSEQWDENSWSTMSKDPEMIKLLHEDVKSGMYERLQPAVDKLKLFDGGKKSDLDYYGIAAQEYYDRIAQEQVKENLAEQQAKAEQAQAEAAKLERVKADEDARKATQEASKKRKAAAPTRSRAGQRQVNDYLDDSDEAFEEWYKGVEARM